jgi:ubiquinone/menaquinone biosynthesis C-methylase UbiE
MKALSKSVFDAYTDEYEEWFERNRAAYLSELELLRMVIPERGQGLEVGIGTGKFAAPLSIDFGIDPSKNMLQMAKNLGSRVVLARGEQIPFKDQVFDYALIMVTICFVDEPNRVVEESKRVIRNGGRIVIGIIDRDSWLGKLYLAKKDKSKFYREARFYSVREIIELLRNSNFKNISVYQTIFNPPETLETIQHYRRGSGEGGFAVISGYRGDLNSADNGQLISAEY